MDKQMIIQQLKSLIIQGMNLSLTPDEIKGDNLEQEININSVDFLEIMVLIENAFQIEIPDEDLDPEMINNLSKVADYIRSKLAVGRD
ncbi:hypothetical protein K0T92_17360 [Paenibacillus oenotherae]|uniref:Carrier domain-containing protein n=1 Tax=Paenibacillus oenotherae TaxID=1435645 RepID=A0ABS7D9G4_9BACL|nr:phosphopantetheine-binding protein [Paenibacillus oenotherae]MBW7476505.1 hypothetical protein [Paenibacillus oenotherae]